MSLLPLRSVLSEATTLNKLWSGSKGFIRNDKRRSCQEIPEVDDIQKRGTQETGLASLRPTPFLLGPRKTCSDSGCCHHRVSATLSLPWAELIFPPPEFITVLLFLLRYNL